MNFEFIEHQKILVYVKKENFMNKEYVQLMRIRYGMNYLSRRGRRITKMQMTPKQQKLVKQNHNLIFLHLRLHNLPVSEFYDVAAIGLCKAAINYNADKGAFSTYARWCIKSEVGHVFQKERARDIN